MVTLFTYYLTCQCVSTWLIRSGEPVQQRTDFPFIALLMTYASMCTGSLVSTRAVLTAGHCVCGETPIVRVRDHTETIVVQWNRLISQCLYSGFTWI
ncbi:uncharacterized protein DC041_0003282 [Schistosoma bovis]|uniref:Peptidase S1 domain-containing protein n=1 Tax=Schistosoma bovis TaxID=6184 RepID=A0A430PYL7_SCHBO|nr:uncharacterized protein DC041_0003282 [Schistosoma bovis]